MRTVVLRIVWAGLSDTENRAVPLPDWPPDTTVANPEAVADQLQPAPVDTATEKVPVVLLTEAEVGDTE